MTYNVYPYVDKYTKKATSTFSPSLPPFSPSQHQENGHHFGSRQTTMLNVSFICFSVDTRQKKI